MKVKIIYKGGQEEEIFECERCYAHSSGGWMIVQNENEPQSGIFISSADIRKIYQMVDDNAKQQA